MKIDLYATHKADYIAPKTPKFVKVDKAQYLTIEGKGKPGGEAFQGSIGALYAAAYTMKFASKFAGQDYGVCKLEGLWWVDDGKCWSPKDADSWNWKLMIRTPDFIGKEQLKQAHAKLKAKADYNPLVAKVKLEKLTEGNAVQMLHVGPYSEESKSIEKMQAFAAESGMEFRGRHHEIYLSDPNRVAPEKLKTILRMPVQKA